MSVWIIAYSQTEEALIDTNIDSLTEVLETSYELKNYASAIDIADELLHTAHVIDNWDTWNIAFTKKVNSLYSTSNYKKIIETAQEQIDLLKGKSVDPEIFAKLYNWIGFAAYFTDDQGLALEANLQTIRIYEDLQKPSVAMSAYANAGINYTMQADYAQAKKYLLQAEHYAEQEKDQRHLGRIWTNLARAYWASGENQLSLDYLYRLKEYKGLNFELAMNLIDCHLNEGNVQEVETLLRESESFMNDPVDSLKYFWKHALLLNLKDDDDRKIYIDKALDIENRLNHNSARLVSKCHISKAQFLLEEQSYQESAQHFLRALKLLDSTFINRYIESNEPDHLRIPLTNAPWIMDCLFGLTQTSSELFKQELTDRIDFLKYNKLCFDVIDHIRLNFSEENSSLLLSEYAHKIYANSLKFSLGQLKTTSSDPLFQNLALESLERSRNFSLTSNLNEIRAKEMADIPDSLLNREHDLLDLITQMKLNQDEAAEIFNHQRELYELRNIYKNNYPKFYEISFERPDYTIKELRKKLNNDHEGYLYFFQSDSSLYKVFISNDVFVFREDIIDGVFEYYVNKYNHLLINPHESFRKDKLETTFTEAAYYLYHRLFEGFIDIIEYNRINILASGITHHITFESLLSKAHEGKLSFSSDDLQYMIEDVAINYKYSAFIEDVSHDKIEYKHDFVGFAPTFTSADSSTYRSCNNEKLSPLKYNKREVSNIAQIMRGQEISGEDATKASFLDHAETSQFIHLATHACAEDNDADNHKIFFANNEHLTAAEIYNIQSPTEFLVLSACETGIGKSHSSEGVMHLARAFSYAGISSVSMSLWALPDFSTSRIMESFYFYLNSGKYKSQALRQAKLKYISEADPSKQHPHYWAAMIITGNDDPIMSGRAIKLPILIGVTLLFLIFVYWIWYNKKARP